MSSGQTRKRVLIGACALIVLAIAGVIAEPTGVVRGWLAGDRFFGDRPTRFWIEQLQDGPAEREAARTALEKGDADSAAMLVDILKQSGGAKGVELRWSAIEMLAKKGVSGPEVQEALLVAVKDADPLVQSVAAGALAKTGTPADRAVPALIELLPTQHSVIASRTLSEYRSEAEPAIPALIELLSDASQPTEARWNAARTLGKVGPKGASAVKALVTASRDPEPTIREHSVEAIGDIGPAAAPEGLPALVAALSDEYFKARRDAVRSMGYIGELSRPHLAEIRRLLNDPEEIVRTAARTAIKAIDPDAELPPENPAAQQPNLGNSTPQAQ